MKNRFFKILILGVITVSAVIYAKGYRNYNPKLSLEKAEQIAFSHAKVSKNDALVKRTKLDREHGRIVYEIEFYDKNNRKYEYDVDADKGEVVSYQHETKRRGNNSYYNNDVNNGERFIGEAKAKSIALSRVRGAKDLNIVKLHLDREDGRMVYEGKIIYNNTEYEFDIDAITGDIVSWEEERY